ncbi:unnamed protein product [Adineta ricciae]|uniref:Uncharacterized protein n=2 Tax=Adineta ricciae TaxID=249248 RepID=A0A815S4N5_ADIRI|nr:unnamed protein product [Adineta ricciae]
MNFNGQLITKVNRTALDYPFSFIPNVHDSIERKLYLVENLLDRVIQCCSNVEDFQREYIELEFVFASCHLCFSTLLKHLSDRLPYACLLKSSNVDNTLLSNSAYKELRQSIQETKNTNKHKEQEEEKKKKKKKKEEEEEEQQELLTTSRQPFYLYCPLDGERFYLFEENVQSLWKQWSKQIGSSQSFDIKLLHRRTYPHYTV